MTEVTIAPGSLHGAVVAPASKSYTHRAVVAAHLAPRGSTIRRPLIADDTLRTVGAVRALGSRVRRVGHDWHVTPGVASSRRERSIDCGESGTTLRLTVALAALQTTRFRFVGEGRLPRRPMLPLVRVLRALGATVSVPASGAALPMRVRGPIHGGPVELDPSSSSQFTSALLFALPRAERASTLRFTGRVVSEPYVRATVAVLRDREVLVYARRNGFSVPAPQSYRARDWMIPGDASSAAYLWAGAAVSGGSVAVRGIPPEWPQADLAVLTLLRRFGALVRKAGTTIRVDGGRRRAFRFDLDAAPDLYPLAGVLAATAPGRSVLEGGEHAAVKESDRRTTTARLARSMGARVKLSAHRLVVEGSRRPRPLRLVGNPDHRVVMSAAVAALAASGSSRISDASSVDKSYPRFFEDWARLGGEVRAA